MPKKVYPPVQQVAKQWARFVGRLWADPDFKNAFLANPKKVLKDNGFPPLPANVQIKVHQDNQNTIHLSIPFQAAGVSEEDLEHEWAYPTYISTPL
jgi:hypothetical protein